MQWSSYYEARNETKYSLQVYIPYTQSYSTVDAVDSFGVAESHQSFVFGNSTDTKTNDDVKALSKTHE